MADKKTDPKAGQGDPQKTAPTAEDWTRFLQRERELTRLESSLKERERALKEREDELSKHQESMQLMQKDPIAWAEQQGLSYEEWTRRILGDGKADPVKQLERRLASREQEIQELRQLIEGNQQTWQMNQTNNQIANALRQFDGILADPKFDAVRQYAQAYEKFTGQKIDIHEAAKSIALQHYQAHEKDLTLQEIADTMLSEAQARIEAMPEPAKQSLLGTTPKPAEPEKQVPSKQETEGASQTTLTAGTETSSPPANFEDMPWEERLEYVKTHGPQA